MASTARRPPSTRSASCASRSTRSTASCSALLNRRAGVARAIGELKRAEGSPAFRPEREAAGDRRPEGAQRRPAADRERGADLARDHVGLPRARNADAGRLPRPGRHLQRAGRARLLRLVDRRVPCANADEVFHATSAGAADFGVVPVENSSEGVVTRSLDLFLTTPLDHRRRDQPVRAPQPAAPDDSLDGIDAVCAHPQALAQCHAWLSHHLPNAERRPVASNAEGARLAEPRPDARRHRQRARGERVRPASSSRRRSRTMPTTAPASRSSPIPTASAAEGVRATTAPASSSRSPTGRARCTTCWCR